MRPAAPSSTVDDAMISMANNTFALTHGAPGAAVAACRPMKLRIDDTPSGV